MPLIDTDKKIMYDVSCKKHCDYTGEEYFRQINEKEESYYLQPGTDETDYLVEYEFDTPMELKTELEKLFQEKGLPSEYLNPVLVMALKLKGNNDDKKEVLMETIYNF